MADYYPPCLMRNCLLTAYDSLRTLGRFVEGSHVSPYQEFFEKVLNKKLEGELPHAEVESYYLKRSHEEEFVSTAKERLCGGNGTDSDLMERLLSSVWEIQLATPTHAQLCTGATGHAGRQLWEMFIRLDIESQRGLHSEDVCDLVLRIFKANGHIEKPEVVMGWFGNQEVVYFWQFFQMMSEQYTQFLQNPVVAEIYQLVSTETIKEGKLSKKGHIVPNWKGRWFTLKANTLTYREARDAPILKTIVINDKTQIQNMPEMKGHIHRFRVLDGTSATPTEISATDESTLREWMAFIKLAIKMNQIDGRNFLHKYRLALNSFPKSFFSQSSGLPAFTAAPLVKHTSPTHRALKSAQSVPLGNADAGAGRESNTLPSHKEIYEFSDGPDVNDAPPVPPQRFQPQREDDVFSGHHKNPQRTVEKSAGDHKPARRRSSLDSSEIEHIQVDGDLVYAVVNKAQPKRRPNRTSADGNMPPGPPPRKTSPALMNKAKSTDSPPLPLAAATPPNSTSPLPPPHTSTPPPPPPHASTRPQQVPPRRVSPGTAKALMDTPTTPAPPPRSPRASPQPVRKGYIELQFEKGNLTSEATPTNPVDISSKFGYAEVQFQGSKEREKEFEEGEVKKEKKPPPAPRHQGGMPKSSTDSNLPSARSNVSNGAHSEVPPRTKPSSLPELKSQPKKKQNLDYADVVFSNNPSVSPSITHRILDTPPEEPVAGGNAPRVEYSTVILAPSKKSKTDKRAKDSGYDNVELNGSKIKNESGYVNFDFSGSRSKSPVVESDYEIPSLVLTNGPTVAGSARLVTSETRRQDPPKAKPRAAPRKGVSSSAVSLERAPVPPARKASNNT